MRLFCIPKITNSDAVFKGSANLDDLDARELHRREVAQQEISDLPEAAREVKITEERERMRAYERGRETVPSSRASLPESLSINENAPLGIHNSASPLIDISDDWSTMSSVGATRPAQYPSPQSRVSDYFPQAYAHGQPSTAYSDASPRDSSTMYYCPVPGCARSEGGRGFKRKNEMIRHGLIHESPGYICPFCPEREHKYPRSKNLRRYNFALSVETNDSDLS